MTVPDPILSAIVEAVFGYLVEKVDPVNWALKKTGLDPERRAFKRALGTAVEALASNQRTWVNQLFDASFFQNEGAPILAQFMIRNGRPEPSALAAAWADSLRLIDPERRTASTRDLEPVAADFLEALGNALKAERDLDALHDSRALEHLVEDVQALRSALGADQATPGTKRDYLHWLIERNIYLDPRGTYQTQRQVQVKLTDVYVSLRGQREDVADRVDRRLQERELAEIEARLSALGLSNEEAEDQREELLRHAEMRWIGAEGNRPGEIGELAEAVARHDRLVILGDPGSGKTTLLRYLALQHAQALWRGSADVDGGLGPARFPILVRIAEYVEQESWRQLPLSDFLTNACTLHECPRPGLEDLFHQELASGNCLILLDGLDEVVEADDRRSAVNRIEDFVRRHDDCGNRFVVTSRVAGYRSASLGPSFAQYLVQEMDDAQILQFLQHWCPAVEEAQTPELSFEARQATAQREIDGILEAVTGSPGVQRLASNPLLLRVLALIHRTGARLPQRRIELYKISADTLARTWRPAQGVPESALVEERYLTPLLGKLAYEIHRTKPTGIATTREVHQILGAEWARIKRLDIETQHEEIQGEVDRFLRAVREHTGLFVERAPRRYGFMHLTFEEYYAARHLVRLSKDRARLIRQHLHDARWEEPIVLALGFVSLDYPEEAADLLEVAILAQGEEAAELSFARSAHEDLLGRDFLSALRCLGDMIPVHPETAQELIERLADEVLYQSGSARFRRYRQAIEERLAGLAGTEIAHSLVNLLAPALAADNGDVRVRAAHSLVQLGQASPDVVAALIQALADDNEDVRVRAAQNLGHLGQSSPDVVAALIQALADDNIDVCVRSYQGLVQLGQASPDVVSALAQALVDESPSVLNWVVDSLVELAKSSHDVVVVLIQALAGNNGDVRASVAQSLGQLEHPSPDVVIALTHALADDNLDVRLWAAESLVKFGQFSPDVIATLIRALADDNSYVRVNATESLGKLTQFSPDIVVAALIHALNDDNRAVRFMAAQSLGELGRASPDVTSALIHALAGNDRYVRSLAAQSLGKLGQASPDIVAALIQALADDKAGPRVVAAKSLVQLGRVSSDVVAALIQTLADDNGVVRFMAAQSLSQLGQASSDVVAVLIQSLANDTRDVRFRAAQNLVQLGQSSPDVVAALIQALADDNEDVRFMAAQSLVQLGQSSPDVVAALTQALADDNGDVRVGAVQSLVQLGQSSPDVVAALCTGTVIATSGTTRRDAAQLIGRIASVEQAMNAGLLEGFLDDDNDVRIACGEAMVELALRYPRQTDEIVAGLVKTIRNPDYRKPAIYAHRSGQDYAYDALWSVVGTS